MDRDESAGRGSSGEETTDPVWAHFNAKAFTAHVCSEIDKWAKVVIPYLDATNAGPQSTANLKDGVQLPLPVLLAQQEAV